MDRCMGTLRLLALLALELAACGARKDGSDEAKIDWVLGDAYHSCDAVCNNGRCCYEEVDWPQSRREFVQDVLDGEDTCKTIQSGGARYDPSIHHGHCGWEGDCATNSYQRCTQAPSRGARRFCPCGSARKLDPYSKSGEPLTRTWLDGHPLAVCNDGSQAAYYFRPAKPEGQGMWYVHLEGGGQCQDVPSCAARPEWLTSSKAYTPFQTKQGVWSPQSPVYKANQVYLPYCSSDAWIGNISADNNPTGFHFRGSVIVHAVLKELVQSHGLAAGDIVVFGGGSAGARGAMGHLDSIVAPLGPLPQGVRLLGFLDSPYFIDQATYDTPDATANGDPPHNLTKETIQVVNLTNGTGTVAKPDCLDKLGEAWKCFFGEYRMPTLRTPFLLIASQYDFYQFYMNLHYYYFQNHTWPRPSRAYIEWIDHFARATRSKIDTFLKRTERSHVGVLSWTCYAHAESEGPNFFKLKPSGFSMAEALEQAIQNITRTEAGGVPMPIGIDDCHGMDCGPTCNSRYVCR